MSVQTLAMCKVRDVSLGLLDCFGGNVLAYEGCLNLRARPD